MKHETKSPTTIDGPVIETRNLTRAFGRLEAVRLLDLAVAPGRIVALLGRNGAGKTTALRMIANLIRPTVGEARVFGKPVARLTEADRTRLGYVSENQDLPDWMTLQQLIRFFKPMYPNWDDAFCERLVALFDLPLDRPLKHQSRGMRMKAAFLSSLAYHPELLILDEPFSGLDLAVREDLLDAMIELTAQEKWTILISSHDIDEIERLADEIAFIEEGRLVLREELDVLQSRCRDISVEGVASLPPDLPARWVHPHIRGGAVQFLETRYDEARTRADIARFFPENTGIEIRPGTLKAIHLAFLRALKTNPPANLNEIWNHESATELASV